MNAPSPVPALPELRLIEVQGRAYGLEGARASYMEAGSAQAPAVVLLHGIGSNCTGWRYVLDGLQDRFRVIAWNAPGYYLSHPLGAQAPSIEQYADAVAALMDALHIDEARVCGSSFGSLVAQAFAARHSRRTRRLALLGASRGHQHLPAEERMRRLRGREESIREAGGIGLAKSRWQNLVAADASPIAVRLTQEVLRATDERGFLQAARATAATESLAFAGAIAAPTVLAVGTEDAVNPVAVSEAIHRAIPDSRLVRLPGVGHLPKLEAPEKTVQILLDHFTNGEEQP